MAGKSLSFVMAFAKCAR
jgi:hypothetical protein